MVDYSTDPPPHVFLGCVQCSRRGLEPRVLGAAKRLMRPAYADTLRPLTPPPWREVYRWSLLEARWWTGATFERGTRPGGPFENMLEWRLLDDDDLSHRRAFVEVPGRTLKLHCRRCDRRWKQRKASLAEAVWTAVESGGETAYV